MSAQVSALLQEYRSALPAPPADHFQQLIPFFSYSFSFYSSFLPCLSIFCSGREGEDFSSFGMKYNYAHLTEVCGVYCGFPPLRSPFDLVSVCL